MRYDGGHKRDAFVVEDLSPHARLVPVCPEVELGLGTPRETLRLINRDGVIRLIMKTGEDHTAAMTAFSVRRTRELRDEDLDGYILKKDSPSCGYERVKVYGPNGGMTKSGRGVYATALLETFPDLPVEDEGRLNDPTLRENFIERVFAYRRLKSLFRGRWTYGAVVAFHTAHKFTLLAHGEVGYRELGRLVASGKAKSRPVFESEYRSLFMRTMAKPATATRHTNVLTHMVGHFRQVLDEISRRELTEEIDAYRRGKLPLIVPVTLVRHHARRLGVDYLLNQVYLDPHPRELALRNHV